MLQKFFGINVKSIFPRQEQFSPSSPSRRNSLIEHEKLCGSASYLIIQRCIGASEAIYTSWRMRARQSCGAADRKIEYSRSAFERRCSERWNRSRIFPAHFPTVTSPLHNCEETNRYNGDRNHFRFIANLCDFAMPFPQIEIFLLILLEKLRINLFNMREAFCCAR